MITLESIGVVRSPFTDKAGRGNRGAGFNQLVREAGIPALVVLQR